MKGKTLNKQFYLNLSTQDKIETTIRMLIYIKWLIENNDESQLIWLIDSMIEMLEADEV